ncbi:hypothetical protein HID58_042877 [Brassica napus]|uniref:Checkpoint protein n=1 Tax=Brassica napus TaxID=3708 RepID=A0ABQ8BEZ7_BRANA|nr:hypothetical protein HID58_042877 [Brassica napus]
MKSNGNSHVSTGKSPVAFNFKVMPEGSLESELQFQLIHFSEARNAAKGGSLIGLELLLIKDEQGTVIVSSSHAQYTCRISNMNDYLRCQKQNDDHSFTVSFSYSFILSVFDHIRLPIDEDRLGSNPEIAYLVNEVVLTKAETMTIREIFAYIKQESAKYLAKISVYDNNDQSLPFLVMQDVSRLELTRRCLSPKALINTIGQTHKFSVMVSEYSLTGNTQTTIATKVLFLTILPPLVSSDENPLAPTSEVALQRPNSV